MDEEAMELLARQAVKAGVSRSSFAQAAEHYWDQADEELAESDVDSEEADWVP